MKKPLRPRILANIEPREIRNEVRGFARRLSGDKRGKEDWGVFMARAQRAAAVKLCLELISGTNMKHAEDLTDPAVYRAQEITDEAVHNAGMLLAMAEKAFE